MRAVKHIMLWIISTVVFTLASSGLELIEGDKITTTEYYGFRNIGFVIIFLNFLFSSVLYPIVLFPLSWIARKISNPFISRVMILILSAIGGYVFFYKAYNDRFILEYHLNSSTAIILFGIAGFVYVLVDYFIERKIDL